LKITANASEPMSNPLIPSLELRKLIESRAFALSSLCWTCGSCDLECPVNRATNRLRPQKLVRMANLGMLEELLGLPEIWYCLNCRRCMMTCPTV
jgi:heterodisulfide reductase subunit C